MKNDDLLHLQRAAGLTLQWACEVLYISREDFSRVLAKCLCEELKKQDKEGPIDETVLSYFQGLPQKYLKEKGYPLFRIAVENAVQALCDESVICTIDGDAITNRWTKHGEEILHQLDEIYRKANEVRSQAVTREIQRKIENLLSN